MKTTPASKAKTPTPPLSVVPRNPEQREVTRAALDHAEQILGRPANPGEINTIEAEIRSLVSREAATRGLDSITRAHPTWDFGDAIDGAAWGTKVPETLPAIWGYGERAYWTSGEFGILYGGDGTNKTTLAHGLLAGMLSFPGREKVLGYPVTPLRPDVAVIYLALDRPRQIERSWSRFHPGEYQDLTEGRLVVWPKGVPSEVINHPEWFLPWLEELAWREVKKRPGAVIIDNAIDAFGDFAKTENATLAGWILNDLARNDVDTLALAHDKKEQGATPRKFPPASMDGLYGGRNFRAKSGTVVNLWKPPGNDIGLLTVTQFKEPSEQIPRATFLVDPATARMTPLNDLDLWTYLEKSGQEIDLKTAASMDHKKDGGDLTAAEKEATRRKLDGWVETGEVESRKTGKGTSMRVWKWSR